MTSLAESQEARFDSELDAWLDTKLQGLAAPISPQAKIKLRGILKKYAKDPHPFKACVRDNTKRWGPGRTEAICATLKDTIKGRKDWRKGGAKMSEDDLQIDGDILIALDHMSEVDLQGVLLAARAHEEHGSYDTTLLLGVTGADELKLWGDRVA